MTFAGKFQVIAITLAAFLLAGSAKAGLVEFTFTGTGINGSIASGNFTVNEGSLYPGYFATGGIFPTLALSISNIPGGGPTFASFDVNDIAATWFSVDANNVPYIAPYGSHSFGAPFENHYDLGQPSQPFLPSAVFETGLSYNGSPKDVITWSIATPVGVPEPGSVWLGLTALAIGAIALRRCTFRRSTSQTR